MNKKKILSLCLVICLLAVAVVGGTLAYFTDTDADLNVMTTGNVVIIQNETDRNGDAWADDDTAHLVPAVYLDAEGQPYNPTYGWEGPAGDATGTCDGPDGNTMSIYDANINNEVDKIVSVTNDGTEPAYVRTFVLLEDTNNMSDKVHIAYSDMTREVIDNVAIGDETFEVWIFTYEEAIQPGATSPASLKQVWLDPLADNSWKEAIGEDGFTILVFSQATQVQGFEDFGAEVALDTAFGDATADSIVDWLDEVNGPKTTGAQNVIGGGSQQ